MTINSSYVLIKYHTFLQTRERVGARPSASRVSILYYHGASSEKRTDQNSVENSTLFRESIKLTPKLRRRKTNVFKAFHFLPVLNLPIL